MIRNIYYIPFLVVSVVVMAYLVITFPEEKLHSLTAPFPYFVFIGLVPIIILRFVREKYKNLVHMIMLIVFIGLMLIFRSL